MDRSARAAGDAAMADQARIVAELLALPPLGQTGRLKYAALLQGAVTLLGAQGATVGFWVSPGELRRFRARAGEGGSDVHEDVGDPGRSDGPVATVLRSGGARLLGPETPAEPGGEYPGFPSVSRILLGLRLRDEPPALLSVHRFGGTPFAAPDRERAELLAPLFATALDNLRRFSRAEELSITDGLTGVYNYRYLRSALDKEVARARRFREKFSIIMLDVDHLKEYNDVHGHLRGSEVLRRLAGLVTAELRGADIVAKYGGDEFVIILPQTERPGARILAERIRRSVEAHEFPGEDKGMKITSSMGIAQFPEDGEVSRDLLDAADTALYEAKRSGRNRVSAESRSA
ncbi:MAG: diguanylate cyclase [Candidatus Eiseniibacteriota bacterium]